MSFAAPFSVRKRAQNGTIRPPRPLESRGNARERKRVRQLFLGHYHWCTPYIPQARPSPNSAAPMTIPASIARGDAADFLQARLKPVELPIPLRPLLFGATVSHWRAIARGCGRSAQGCWPSPFQYRQLAPDPGKAVQSASFSCFRSCAALQPDQRLILLVDCEDPNFGMREVLGDPRRDF